MHGKTAPDNDIESTEPGFATGEPPNAPLRFSLRTLLIVTTVICALLAIVVPVLRIVQRSARIASCQNNLKQIALALQNYHDVYKTFPWAITYAQDGTPMHSWRVRVMPFIEQGPFLDHYNLKEPWNGPTNGLLGDEIPDTWYDKQGTPYQQVHYPYLFRCPAAPRSQNPMNTSYVMLIDDRPGQPNGPPHPAGSVPPNSDFDSTIIVVEMADSGIHWMEPHDLLLSELSLKINDRARRSLSSYHGGACVAHADGSVELLDDETTAERLKEMLTQ